MFAIARAPLRVSFFGGGTDYPTYFERRPGAVVGAALNRYIYISASPLLWLADYKYRVAYSKTELCNDPSEIQHPVVREALKRYYLGESLDISIFSDIPARTGLGSSSTFTVCLLRMLAHLNGTPLSPIELAAKAFQMEHDILKETVGVQDQMHAAFGGINRFDFFGDKKTCLPVKMSGIGMDALSESMFLIYTGKTRSASETLDEQLEKTARKAVDQDLQTLFDMVGEAVRILENPYPAAMITDFGRLMHEGWMVKKSLSSKISNDHVDDLYDRARQAGALGGKLCGAGTGGFLLVVVPDDAKEAFKHAMGKDTILPVGFDRDGATILHQSAMDR